MAENFPPALYLYALSNLLSCIVFVGLAVFVFLEGRHSATHRLFALWCLSVGVWALAVFKQSLATDSASALLWSRILHAGAVFIPVLFLHFILAYLKQNIIRRRLLTVLYSVGLGFLLLAVYPNSLLIKEVTPITLFRFYPKAGVLYPYFLLFFSACIGIGFYKLGKAYASAPAGQRNQILYLLSAMILGFGGGMTAFFHVFNIPIFPYGNYGLVAICAVIITYAIARYRLMDITVVFHKGLAYSLLLGLILVPSYGGILISHRATLYAIPPLLVGSLVFACGLWIVLKNPRASANIGFGLVCAGTCLWLFGTFMMYSAPNDEDAVFWGRFVYVGVVFIPAFFYQFCTSFLQRDVGKAPIVANYLISTVFLALIPTGYLLNGHYSYFWGSTPKAGSLHPLFLGYFALVNVLSLHTLYLGYKAKEGIAPLDASRIQYIFWACVLGNLASIDFAQSYGLEFYPPGVVFVSLWISVVTYAIVKYQVLGISLHLDRRKLLPYGQALALLSFYLVILVLLRVLADSTYALAGILLALFAIFAGLFVNLQRRIEKAVGKALFRQRYDAYETLTEFTDALFSIRELKALQEKIVGTLSRVMETENVSLFLLEKERDAYGLAAARQDQVRLKEVKSRGFMQYLRETDGVILSEELERHATESVAMKEILNTLSLMKAALCIPLKNKERVIGFLNLGPKTKRNMYSREDLDLLAVLAKDAAIALDYLGLYEESKRSQRLLQRTDRLRSLETIAGGFAHEIRNPLTSIKTFVQLTTQRKDDSEFIRQFSTVVSEDVARIERLIQEILDYARYMEPKFSEEQLTEVITSCLYFIEVAANGKGVTLEKDFADDLPLVRVDRQQLKQVLLNLFMNALEAMDSGGVLTVKTHRLSKPTDAPWVQIEIADTGCGIPPADRDHIFDPFYTTKHASKEREGTGLGLTIVHQIVHEHGGHIDVQSEVGRGTTFYVNLPANLGLRNC